MTTFTVRITARIADEMEVEAENVEEALAAAEATWHFTEATDWESAVVDDNPRVDEFGAPIRKPVQVFDGVRDTRRR